MTDWTVWRLSRTQEALARRSDVEVALVYAEYPRGCRACGNHPGFAHSEPQHVRAYAGEDGALRDFVWPGPGGRDLSQVFVAPRVVEALRSLEPVPRTVPVALDARMQNRHDEPGRKLARARCEALAAYEELRPTAAARPVPELSYTVDRGSPHACSACGSFPLAWWPPPPGDEPPRFEVAFLAGVERFQRLSMGTDALGRRDHAYQRVPSTDDGVAFRAGELDGAHLWRPQGTSTLLCTTRFKHVMESMDATGVTFLRVGRLVD